MNLVAATASLILLFQPATQTMPKFDVKLLAAHASVAPGSTSELMIEISVSEPWHIYHPVILDTGAPTRIRFTTPPGVEIGDVRFPTPTLGELADFEYLEFSEKIRCVAPLTIADDVRPGQTLAIKARVDALACVEMCVKVNAEATLTIPVTDERGAPANAKLFEEARGSLAPTFADAAYIKGSTLVVSKSSLKIDEPAELVATIRVKKHHHIQDRDPGVEGLIASRLFIEPVNGIEFAEEKDQIWPKPKVKEVQYLGKVREQSGEFQIRVPFKIVDKKFPAGPVKFRVLFQHQCCTDEGQCFAPEMAAGVVSFVADTPNAPALAATESEEDEPAEPVAAVATDAAPKAGSPAATRQATQSLWWILIAGFIGGLILNIMPCVLPVISIKIISFVQQAGEDPKRVFRLGLAFCAGIMVWFWLFAILAASGDLPLQSPVVVISVATIMFVFALNLFGVFEIVMPGSAAGSIEAVAAKEGYLGSFFKGFLATLLGTACTAPFLVSALGYTATTPPLVDFLVFSAAGLGMASPYFFLTWNPAWLKYVPKPGMWMITFKQAMGFVLLGTAVWLLSVLLGVLDGAGVVWTVCFWTFLSCSVWLIGQTKLSWKPGSRFLAWSGALAIGVVGWYFSYHVMYDWEAGVNSTNQIVTDQCVTPDTDAEQIASCMETKEWQDGIPWQQWYPGVGPELAAAGFTVYVDYTADWCLTCQTNKKVILETDRIRELMRSRGVIPIKADYTKSNPQMRKELQAHGTVNVPLNLVYPAGQPDDPISLPVVLTPTIVQTALDDAGPSERGVPAIVAAGEPVTQ